MAVFRIPLYYLQLLNDIHCPHHSNETSTYIHCPHHTDKTSIFAAGELMIFIVHTSLSKPTSCRLSMERSHSGASTGGSSEGICSSVKMERTLERGRSISDSHHNSHVCTFQLWDGLFAGFLLHRLFALLGLCRLFPLFGSPVLLPSPLLHLRGNKGTYTCIYI